MKKATEFLCERLFWYIQRDTADKKIQKLQSDVKRCQTSQPDFGSAFELLKQQKDSADEEKAKYCSRLDAADEKLQLAVQQLVGRLQQSKPDDVTKPQSEHRPSETPAPDLEARLSASQKSAEASFAKMLAQESAAIKKSLRAEFDSKTAELKAQTTKLEAQLCVEKLEKAQLKKSLQELEHRVNDSDKVNHGADSHEPEQGSHAHATPALQPEKEAQEALAAAAKIKEEIKSLVSRDELNEALRKLDIAISSPEDGSEKNELQDEAAAPGVKTALRLRTLISKLGQLESSVREQDVGQLATRVQGLRTEVDSHAEAIKQQADQQSNAKSAIQSMELSLTKLSASRPAEDPAKTAEGTQGAASNVGHASAPDRHIQEIIRTEVDILLRDFLPHVSNKLSNHLKGETEKRELVAEIADKTADAATALRTDIDNLKQECTRSFHELAHGVSQVHSGLTTCENRTETLERTCAAARAETKSETDELAMQVRDLQSWQNNFTTRPLYKDIVDHINATLPNGVLTQLKNLGTRVGGIESHLHAAEGAEAKKRKMQAPGMAASIHNYGQQGDGGGKM